MVFKRVVTLGIEVDQSQDGTADSLECDCCGSAICHDEWMYQLRPGFNLHGDYIQAGGLNRRYTICKRCILDFLDEDTDAVEVGGSVRDATACRPSKRRSGGADNIDEMLEAGISVPENVPHTIHLPRRVQDESLAVAICEEIVLGADLRGGGIELEHADIRNHFGRSISYDRLDDVFAYLRGKGACRKSEEYFVFTKYDLDAIMGVRSDLQDTTVQEYLEDREDRGEQTTLDDEFGEG